VLLKRQPVPTEFSRSGPQPGNDVVVYKGVLFQAKKYRGDSRANLIDQVRKMEQLAPGGSALFEFGPKGYTGASGQDIIVRRARPWTESLTPQNPWATIWLTSFCDVNLVCRDCSTMLCAK
jgi:hypothetical protein